MEANQLVGAKYYAYIMENKGASQASCARHYNVAQGSVSISLRGFCRKSGLPVPDKRRKSPKEEANHGKD